MSKTDEYLKGVLKNREKELGANGDHKILIRTRGQNLLKIHSLDEKVAKQIFDLLDECHYCVMPYQILLLNEKEEIIDEARLPNVFTQDL